MSETKKAKIVKSTYKEASDLVLWEVIFEDGVEQAFCWPSSDLISAMGIKGNLEPKHVHDFCAAVQGKTINMVIEGEPKFQAPEADKKDYDNLKGNVERHFENFKNIGEKYHGL